ncbi:hypothetical protein ScPMuIL_012727 [Solemya velum]
MSSNILQVRALYKGILRLHRGLPRDLKAIGDQYVKEEFRLHKDVSSEEGAVFLEEWKKYYVTMAKQVRRQHKQSEFGGSI